MGPLPNHVFFFRFTTLLTSFYCSLFPQSGGRGGRGGGGGGFGDSDGGGFGGGFGDSSGFSGGGFTSTAAAEEESWD